MGLSKGKSIKYSLEAEYRSAEWPPHRKIPPERDLAVRFGVNVLTVSRVLGELVSEGVLYRVRRKGTFIAPPVHRHQMLIVADQVGRYGQPNVDLQRFFSGIYEAAKKLGGTVVPLLIHSEDFTASLPHLEVVFRDLSGVLFFRDGARCLASQELLAKKSIPFAFYGSDFRARETEGVHRLLYSEADIAGLAAERILSTGRTTFTVPFVKGFLIHAERKRLFEEIFRERGGRLDPALSFELDDWPHPDLDDAFRGRLGPWLRLVKDRGAAIYSPSDWIGLRILEQARRLGFDSPDDPPVVSVNNSPVIDLVGMPLTSIDIPVERDAERLLLGFSEALRMDGPRFDERSELRVVARSDR